MLTHIKQIMWRQHTKTMTLFMGVDDADINVRLNSTENACFLSISTWLYFGEDKLYLFDCEVFLTKLKRVALSIQSFWELVPLPVPMMTIHACIMITGYQWCIFTSLSCRVSASKEQNIKFVVEVFEDIQYLEVKVEVTLSDVCWLIHSLYFLKVM